MTLAQIALAVGITTVLAGWCARRAVRTGPASIATVYRRIYTPRPETNPNAPPPVGGVWGRQLARAASRLAGSSAGDRFELRHRYPLRAANLAVVTVAARIITAALVGFLAAVVSVSVLYTVSSTLPVAVVVIAPFAVAGLAGWYQLQTIIAVAVVRHRQFRAGAAAYIQLVSVCMTTRRSMTEAVTYAADIGAGPAFETIAAAVHAAPQMGLRVWEALDAVGAEYDIRELQDLASSVGHVARIGVGVETTVTAVATRMRQVGLDEMQRTADKHTSAMVGPTMLFVVGTLAFLAYPLAIRVLDAFSITT